MDGIPFVKVSVEEARESLRHDTVKSGPRETPGKDWRKERAASPRANEQLSADGYRWLYALPEDVRPNNLAGQYPRIANRIADLWKRQLYCERYLDELVMDMRGDRRGFPPAIAAEIAVLKTYFLRTSKVAHYGVWGNRIGVD